MPIPYPSNSKLAGTFTFEGSPGGNNDTKNIIFSYNNFAGVKLVLDNPITSTEINTNDNESFRSIYYKLMKILDNNILYSTENNEQMLIRTVKSIIFSDPLYYPNMINQESGYYPYNITILLNRGYNGTTPQTQYGYSSGYFSNVYCLENTYNPSVINPLLSGTVNNLFYGYNQIDLYFTNYGIGSNLYDYILDRDNFKLRLNMGNDYITSTEMSLIKNGQNHDSLKTRFNNIFSGKVLKVYISEIDAYEEILINSIESFYVSNENQLCPNDLGYMPDHVKLNVTRGYNGTSIITGSYTSSISIVKGSQSYYNNIINAYVEGTNTFQDNLTENINLSINIIQTGSFTQLVSDIIGISTSNLVYGNVKDFVHETLIFNDVIQSFTVRQLLVMVNDILSMNDFNNNKIQYINLIQDSIRVFDQNNLIDFLDYFQNIVEFLKVSTNAISLQAVNQVLTVLINDYFRVLSVNTNAYSEYYERAVDFIKMSSLANLGGDILLQISDSFKLSELLHNKTEIKLIIEEIFKSTFAVKIDGEEYECYAINLENKALTRYNNYNFNSYAHFNNNYYGLSKNGLANLIYTNEDGNEIVSKVKTSFFSISENGYNILGGINNKQKALKYGYFIAKNNGQLGLRVYTDKGSKFDYILKQDYNDNKFRTTFGNNVRGSMFQIELTSFEDFELKECQFIPIVLSKNI